MSQYIITEEQLNRAYGLRHAIYSNIFSDLLDEVHSHPYNLQAERDKVLDEAIKHWENVIEYGKGVSYNHSVTYEWMYRGVVDYLKKLRQEGKVEK
jgi:superoxide dismutase